MNRKDGRKLNTDPLRKVVDHAHYVDVSSTPGQEMILRHELLECGHAILPKHDIYGETNATRRRCRKCRKDAQAATT